jgi:hypothetical protein
MVKVTNIMGKERSGNFGCYVHNGQVYAKQNNSSKQGRMAKIRFIVKAKANYVQR